MKIFLMVFLMATVVVAQSTKDVPAAKLGEAGNWWPEQKPAKAYVTVAWPHGLEEQVIVQTIAGLKARAVNEGSGDEMVWIEQNGKPSDEWKSRTVARLKLQDHGARSTDELLADLIKKRQLLGYVLYTPEANEGHAFEKRSVIEASLNTATMAAARLRAVPVSVKSEERMKKLGLSLLFDARGVEPLDYFTQYEKDFQDRGAVCLLEPKVPHNRDMAIAYGLPVCYSDSETLERFLSKIAPLSVVIGWGMGDEYNHCLAVTRQGLFHTASNWILNGTFHSGAAVAYQPKRLAAFDASKINWNDKRRCVAMLMSDGDNVGFLQGPMWTEGYWKSPMHGSFPMGFSACMADMAQLLPVVADALAEQKPVETSVVQFGGGYFYPDHFAEARTNRWELLRQHARRINKQMERTGVRVMTMICSRTESPESQQALRIFAEEMPSLLGFMMMDYAPYHRGKGRIDWIPNGRGGTVPAVCARYSLWEDMKLPLAGDPEKLSAIINSDDGGVGGWVSLHAWSRFKTSEGRSRQGMPGVNALVHGIDTNNVNVVCPEELLLRIRKACP